MRKKLPEDDQSSRRELQVADDGAADEALEKLKPYLRPEKAKEARTVLTQVVSKSHSGPIPSAEELEHLEAVLPGLADRVVSMAEREQNHRHGTVTSLLTKEFSLRGRGQWIALVALAMLLVAVVGIAWLGDTKSAAWLGGATIVAVVSIFVTGRLFDTRNDGAETTSQEKPGRPTPSQQRLPKGRQPKRR